MRASFMGVRSGWRRVGWVFAGIHAASISVGQWTAIPMHPTGAIDSAFYGSNGGALGGVVAVPGETGGDAKAALWSGGADSWTNLHPASARWSRVQGVYGGQQAGIAEIGGSLHASLWTGSADSWVDLNPDGTSLSQAGGVGDGQQVGYSIVYVNGIGAGRASLWSGTAASWVNLHPIGVAGSSFALGVRGGKQVGHVNGRAGTWSGSAESWVDLNPDGATASFAAGIGGNQQVGRATFGGVNHAGFWTGAASTWVDLHPSSSTNSQANATDFGFQAGFATISGRTHASVWSGTAASWIDLHTLLPVGYDFSEASGIALIDSQIVVSGFAHRGFENRIEAMTWVVAVPEPATCAALVMGGLCLVRRSIRNGNVHS